VAQACTDKETLAAFEDAAKANPFDVRPVSGPTRTGSSF